MTDTLKEGEDCCHCKRNDQRVEGNTSLPGGKKGVVVTAYQIQKNMQTTILLSTGHIKKQKPIGALTSVTSRRPRKKQTEQRQSSSNSRR